MLPSAQALLFSDRGGGETRVTDDEAQGTMERRQMIGEARFLLPSLFWAQILSK